MIIISLSDFNITLRYFALIENVSLNGCCDVCWRRRWRSLRLNAPNFALVFSLWLTLRGTLTLKMNFAYACVCVCVCVCVCLCVCWVYELTRTTCSEFELGLVLKVLLSLNSSPIVCAAFCFEFLFRTFAVYFFTKSFLIWDFCWVLQLCNISWE